MYQKNPGIDKLKNLHEFISEVNLSVPGTGRQELYHHRQLLNFCSAGFRVENQNCHILSIKTHTRECIFNVKVLKVLNPHSSSLTPCPSPVVITVNSQIYIISRYLLCISKHRCTLSNVNSLRHSAAWGL